ncbi:Phasin protein [Bradyrhizobium neotropicale]|uniref:Phasin protein n=1 Tax=Bradyrhizobium neotropicale TaxID=1497615 RepID=UPI001AD719D5|nr:Phasin protein [Bradyrhizobium neotropicale]
MSNHKRAIASKRARGPRKAVPARRNKQAVVRGPKDNPLRPVAAGSTESRKRHDESKQKNPITENQMAALQDGLRQRMRDNNTKGFDLSLVTASLQAYQANFLEMAQVDMQLAFEFGQRLVTIRSPFEFFAVIVEFTSRRIDTFRRYSKQMAAYPFLGHATP